MRCLGVLGGMSWESTALYYRALNQQVAARRGGLSSAKLVLHSVDFAPMAAMQARADWDGAARQLVEAAVGLKAAGAEGLIIATNTMHMAAPAIEAATGLPLLHIADATAAAITAAQVGKVAFLGTRYTMEDESIVVGRLRDRHRLRVLVPEADDRAMIHRVIYQELCRGVVSDDSRRLFVDAIERLRARGAEGVVLGCTEITMLIDAASSPLPPFDSTALHATAAVDWMLAER